MMAYSALEAYILKVTKKLILISIIVQYFSYC
jgi:hypothetical protein